VKIGDLVTYQGRAYVLRGLEPMSVPDRRAQLADPRTGALATARLAEVQKGAPAPDTLGSGDHR
jgi:hypothetical protein